MPATVTVNAPETAAHGASGGVCKTQVDVCKTPSPTGPVPTPYLNVAMTMHVTGGTKRVKCDGASVLVKGAKIGVSMGDEAGSLGGVKSSTIKGAAEPVNYSFDVKFEGKNVVRRSDAFTHNKKNCV